MGLPDGAGSLGKPITCDKLVNRAPKTKGEEPILKILKCIDGNGLDYWLVVTSRGTILGVFGSFKAAKDFINELRKRIRKVPPSVEIKIVPASEVPEVDQGLFSDWADILQEAVEERLFSDNREDPENPEDPNGVTR